MKFDEYNLEIDFTFPDWAICPSQYFGRFMGNELTLDKAKEFCSKTNYQIVRQHVINFQPVKLWIEWRGSRMPNDTLCKSFLVLKREKQQHSLDSHS